MSLLRLFNTTRRTITISVTAIEAADPNSTVPPPMHGDLPIYPLTSISIESERVSLKQIRSLTGLRISHTSTSTIGHPVTNPNPCSGGSASSQALTQHTTDYNNPHRVSCSQVDAYPTADIDEFLGYKQDTITDLTASGTDLNAAAAMVPETAGTPEALKAVVLDDNMSAGNIGIPSVKFNRHCLIGWDAAVAKQYTNASSTPAVIATIGDSWWAGVTYNSSWGLLRRWLETKFENAGGGFVGIHPSHAQSDFITKSRSSNWTDSNLDSTGQICLSYSTATAPGESWTVTTTAKSFDIHYFIRADGGSFTYTIDSDVVANWVSNKSGGYAVNDYVRYPDGGTTYRCTSAVTSSTDPATDTAHWEVKSIVRTVNTATGTPGIGIVTVSTSYNGVALTDASHVLTITIPAGNTGTVQMIGADCKRAKRGVRLSNLAFTGSSTANWVTASNTAMWKTELQNIAPNLVIISLGMNDIGGSDISTADHAENIQTLIDNIKIACPFTSILLMTQTPECPGVFNHSIADYAAVQKAIAIENECGFIDNVELMPHFHESMILGLQGVTATYAGGSWNSSLNVFTVLSGNPSTNVTVGQYVDIYPDASTSEHYICRVLSRNTTSITIDGLQLLYGTKPSTSGNMTCVVPDMSHVGSAGQAVIGQNLIQYLEYGSTYPVFDPNGRRTAYGLNTLPAGYDNTYYCTAFGCEVLKVNNGGGNTGFGHAALTLCTTAGQNSAFGAFCMDAITTGAGGGITSRSCGFGYEAMTNMNGGWSNSVFGAYAGRGMTSGYSNTYFGDSAGYTGTNNYSNIFIGCNAGYYETGSRKLIIDSFGRTDEATARLQSVIYGEMNATLASQNIRFNVGELIQGGGTTGGLKTVCVEQTATLPTSGSAATQIAVNVPSGARIIGCQLRVDTAVTLDGGGTALTCAYVNTPTTAITVALGVARNSRLNKLQPYEFTTGTVTIAVTPTSGSYNVANAGVVRAIVYYETFVDMAALP